MTIHYASSALRYEQQWQLSGSSQSTVDDAVKKYKRETAAAAKAVRVAEAAAGAKEKVEREGTRVAGGDESVACTDAVGSTAAGSGVEEVMVGKPSLGSGEGGVVDAAAVVGAVEETAVGEAAAAGVDTVGVRSVDSEGIVAVVAAVDGGGGGGGGEAKEGGASSVGD